MNSNNNQSNILQFIKPGEIAKKKQKNFDNEVKTICLKCKNLIDASVFYGASPVEKRKGEFLFCGANPFESQGDFTSIDPLTGERTKTLLDDFTRDGRGQYVGKELLVDEPALNFQSARDINLGSCEDYTD